MSIYDPEASSKSAWAALVAKQNKGLLPDEFTWFTPDEKPEDISAEALAARRATRTQLLLDAVI